MTAALVEQAYANDRRSELMRLGKGVIWYQVPASSGLKASAAKDVMVAAIMRHEAKVRFEKESGEGGGCLWYVACLLTRAFQLQALLPALRREGL